MPPRDAHPDQPLLGAICQMCQRALSSPRTKTSMPSAAVLHPPRVCIEAGTQSANQHATCRRFRWGRSPLRGGSIPAPAAQNPLAAESSASCTDRTNRSHKQNVTPERPFERTERHFRDSEGAFESWWEQGFGQECCRQSIGQDEPARFLGRGEPRPTLVPPRHPTTRPPQHPPGAMRYPDRRRWRVSVSIRQPVSSRTSRHAVCACSRAGRPPG